MIRILEMVEVISEGYNVINLFMGFVALINGRSTRGQLYGVHMFSMPEGSYTI